MKWKPYIAFLLFCSLAFTCNTAISHAFPQQRQPEQTLNAPGTVSISNGTDIRIVFGISCDQGRTWGEQQLGSQATESFFCSSHEFMFLIKTKAKDSGQPVETKRTLEDTHRYLVFINQAGVFDVLDRTETIK